MTDQEKIKKMSNPGRRDMDNIGWLDKSIDEYKKNAIAGIKVTVILKPMLYSFVALIVSFFLDVSRVPILGSISVDLAKKMYPNWNPGNLTQALALWWVPVVFYAVFIWYAYMAFRSLKKEIVVSGSFENIDRILEGYVTAIKGISTAVPLIGAAILLVSVKLGPEIFIGISVPFEIKALLVLAIGELFIIVFDEMGVMFNDIINGIKEIRERYFVRMQIDNTNIMIKGLEETVLRSSPAGAVSSTISREELQAFQQTAQAVAQLSQATLENYRAISAMAQDMKTLPAYTQELVSKLSLLTDQLKLVSQTTRATLENYTALAAVPRELKDLPMLTDDMVVKMKSVTESLKTISDGLNNSNTLSALKSLENIVTKR